MPPSPFVSYSTLYVSHDFIFFAYPFRIATTIVILSHASFFFHFHVLFLSSSFHNYKIELTCAGDMYTVSSILILNADSRGDDERRG